MFRFRQDERDKVGATDEDFELLYAYGEYLAGLVIESFSLIFLQLW